LINEIAKNVDAQWYSSIFLHWIPGEKIKMGPIWDFDLGFGNVDYADATFPEGWWVRWNDWISRMLEDPAFAERVKERYAYFDSQRPAIKQNIETWSQSLNLAQAENDSIWQTLGEYVWPNPVVYDTYQEEVDHLVDWLDTRMDWLGNAIAEL
ncbi:CotH kinase family protein, partial [Luminiphilus sp.]|nr:CotH kinase family protein [Luminiphilus sp.]